MGQAIMALKNKSNNHQVTAATGDILKLWLKYQLDKRLAVITEKPGPQHQTTGEQVAGVSVLQDYSMKVQKLVSAHKTNFLQSTVLKATYKLNGETATYMSSSPKTKDAFLKNYIYSEPLLTWYKGRYILNPVRDPILYTVFSLTDRKHI